MASSSKNAPVRTALEVKEELLRAGRLYEDPDFPATDRSLRREGTVRPGIKWRRPWVSLFVNNVSDLQ